MSYFDAKLHVAYEKYIAIDFEYNQSNERKLNLVCCCFYDKTLDVHFSYWLQDPEQFKSCKEHLKQKRDEGFIFVAFNVIAEAQAVHALGLDELKFRWIDLQAEWRMLCNQNNKFAYGRQLLSGKVVKTYPIQDWDDFEDGKNHSKPASNLAACVYKLLGKKIDTDYKDEIRDFIIEGKDLESKKEEILEYCLQDADILYDAWYKLRDIYEEPNSTQKIFKKYSKKNLKDEMLWRGESVARTARMMSLGYPVDIDAAKKFYKAVPDIIKDMESEINSYFPEIEPFEWRNDKQYYIKKVNKIRAWIETTPYKNKWPRTDKGAYSTSLDAFQKFFHARHDYPINCFGSQMLRYCKFRQSLSGFIKPKTTTSKEDFFSFIGSDGRSRCYLNPYGAQTSRYQPKSKGFLFLKAAWMRSMCKPKPGKVICGIDYGSQEFLVAALLSKDRNMIEAYKSGDVYLYFAKLAGAVPWEGSKKDYANERNLFKSTTLGLSYGMGKYSLANKLSQDTGLKVTPDEAQELIDKFEDAYPDYAEYRKDILDKYENQRHLKLIDGWYMFGDNFNTRSTQNFPVQGTGGAILRRAVKMCQDAGLDVIFPLHDCLYVEGPLESCKTWIDTQYDCQTKAFISCFPDMEEEASLIRSDIVLWGSNLKDGVYKSNKGRDVECKSIYIDKRSEKEYEKFKKYFQ